MKKIEYIWGKYQKFIIMGLYVLTIGFFLAQLVLNLRALSSANSSQISDQIAELEKFFRR